ncbi:MAG TPA: diaminopimelate decarboxylase, partial [Clostridiales bacterium]|nr:diaminopimelate decarboxylase [Clostridiales bacterium]
LDEVAACAKKHGKVQRILLRLAPGIDPHTHKAVVTGSVDSKFGVAIETGQAMELTKYALSKNNVKLIGFHCHIGSLIFENTPFSDAAEIMLSFIAEVRKQTGFTS